MTERTAALIGDAIAVPTTIHGIVPMHMHGNGPWA